METVKSQLLPEAMRRLDVSASFAFCSTPDCMTVYFSSTIAFERRDLTQPVLQKDPAGSVPICYCFGLTRSQLALEIQEAGSSAALNRISKWVKQGLCACEIRNPQGKCCLGNVTLEAKKLLRKGRG